MWSQVHRGEPKMAREDKIEKMKVQKVVFASDILTEHGMTSLVDIITIQE